MNSAPDPLAAIRSALPDDYQLSGYLDEGGEGHVFKATLADKKVALKIFRPGRDDRRLMRELQLLKEIDECPYLVQVVDARTISIAGHDTTIVAYELLTGGNLRDAASAKSPAVDETTLLSIGAHVSEAIEALWNKRIVHRDIKPANIMESGDGRYVLVDVGLARHIDLSDITLPGLVAGTNGYMSPEQANGRRSLTIRSDIFSLGMTLYELAAKRHPFNRMQHMVGTISPMPLGRHRTDLSAASTRLIHDMMAPVPARRPANIRDRFIELLEA